MKPQALLQFFKSRADAQRPMVLVSVFETEGSTYSKTGASMLIDDDGVYRGMLSGGCLEGDLAVRAGVVIDTGRPQEVSYDLGARDDELWGLGVGCDGIMRMFLQPLTAADGYAPFAAIARTLDGAPAIGIATVLRSDSAQVPPGATVVTDGVGRDLTGLSASAAAALTGAAAEACAERESRLRSIEIDGMPTVVLCSVVLPPPRILILGAGHDVEPLVTFCGELGWRVTISDHRPAYVDNCDFAGAEACCMPAEELSTRVDLESFDAAVVMSHHLSSDRAYLRQLAATNIGYIGLLGPKNRRERLLEELGDAGQALSDRLHGPAGLDLGGRGPAPIALSIAAQLQQYFA